MRKESRIEYVVKVNVKRKKKAIKEAENHISSKEDINKESLKSEIIGHANSGYKVVVSNEEIESSKY